MTRLPHVEKHLREPVRPFLGPLLEAWTLDEIAASTHYSRRTVEDAWNEIRAVMALRDGHGGSPVARLALLRIVAGLDPCVCQRFAAELSA